MFYQDIGLLRMESQIEDAAYKAIGVDPRWISRRSVVGKT